MKTQYCDRCANFGSYAETMRNGTPCRLGHKPRLYLSPNPDKSGYRRKCSDFSSKKLTIHIATEDVHMEFRIQDNMIPKSVHYHIIDENDLHQVAYLPFSVEGNKVKTILPKGTKFIIEPELDVVVLTERMTADEIKKVTRRVDDNFL